jgi:hypothetical protein
MDGQAKGCERRRQSLFDFFFVLARIEDESTFKDISIVVTPAHWVDGFNFSASSGSSALDEPLFMSALEISLNFST